MSKDMIIQIPGRVRLRVLYDAGERWLCIPADTKDISVRVVAIDKTKARIINEQ